MGDSLPVGDLLKLVNLYKRAQTAEEVVEGFRYILTDCPEVAACHRTLQTMLVSNEFLGLEKEAATAAEKEKEEKKEEKKEKKEGEEEEEERSPEVKLRNKVLIAKRKMYEQYTMLRLEEESSYKLCASLVACEMALISNFRKDLPSSNESSMFRAIGEKDPKLPSMGTRAAIVPTFIACMGGCVFIAPDPKNNFYMFVLCVLFALGVFYLVCTRVLGIDLTDLTDSVSTDMEKELLQNPDLLRSVMLKTIGADDEIDNNLMAGFEDGVEGEEEAAGEASPKEKKDQ